MVRAGFAGGGCKDWGIKALDRFGARALPLARTGLVTTEL